MADFCNPEKVLSELRLKENMIAADFGSGSGGWTIPLAQKLSNGRVYAIDVLEEELSALESKMKLLGINNIEKILSNLENPEGSTLPDMSCDVVLVTNLLFQVKDKEIIFKEAERVLKEGGQLLVVDWETTVGFGPKEDQRVPVFLVKQLAEKYNFVLEKEFSAGDYHYGLIFKKR
ncbi:MAG: class I SAM-dependent methyltransferase [Minisyncoccia bacterium]